MRRRRAPEPATEPLLTVSGLTVDLPTRDGGVRVVDDVSFDIRGGETVGLLGESGCGKTITSLSIMRLLPPGARVSGSVHFEERELLGLADDEMRAVRGDDVSMVFQEPLTSLNPSFTIGRQITDVVRTHRRCGRAAARQRAVEMLERVQIPGAAQRMRSYPHELSGGMRQRALLAMALACEPRLLIADEPTTALDVTVQAQILALLGELREELGMSVLFVTHDLGVVAETCDRVIVMYAGEVVEQSDADSLFRAPRHPYTEALLRAIPRPTDRRGALAVIAGQVPVPGRMPSGCRFAPRCVHVQPACTAAPVPLVNEGTGSSWRCARHGELALVGVAPHDAGSARSSGRTLDHDPLVTARGLLKHFPLRSGVLGRARARVSAVDGVDLDVRPGETLGLVGESGSGKTTTGRLLLRLLAADAGSVTFEGVDVFSLDRAALRRMRRHVQVVFQDPYSSLDPRVGVAGALREPLAVHGVVDDAGVDARVRELVEQVGLDRSVLERFPHELSGGQRQRIVIARALALAPTMVVCDEPLSALDVSTKAQIMNLLTDLQDRLGLTYLFISHDLAVVRSISDRIAVMYLGRIVEVGRADAVCEQPAHPYTEALLSAIPVPDPSVRDRARIVLHGDIAPPTAVPSGCRFHTRCPDAMAVCRTEDPPAFTTPAGTVVHCHLHTHPSGPRLAGRPLAGARSES